MNAPTPSPAKVSSISVPSEALDALDRPLSVTNSVGTASVEFYEAALRKVGIDPESLSFAETVEATRRLYSISADFRRDRADVAKAEKAAKAAKEKADRDAKRKARLESEKAALLAKLAKIETG